MNFRWVGIYCCAPAERWAHKREAENECGYCGKGADAAFDKLRVRCVDFKAVRSVFETSEFGEEENKENATTMSVDGIRVLWRCNWMPFE